MTRPPAFIEIRWCPECGQTDRKGTMGKQAHKRKGGGGEWCYGKPEVIVYERVRSE